MLPLNTWTHVTVTYTDDKLLRLYINAKRVGSVTLTPSTNGINLYMTLANNSPGIPISPTDCPTLSIGPGPFQGSIDEFRVYNRALDMNELCVLVNM